MTVNHSIDCLVGLVREMCKLSHDVVNALANTGNAEEESVTIEGAPDE